MDIKAHLIPRPHHRQRHQIIIPCRKLGDFAKRKAKVGTGDVGEGKEVIPVHPLVQICFPAASVSIFWSKKGSKELCLSMGSPEERSNVESAESLWREARSTCPQVSPAFVSSACP